MSADTVLLFVVWLVFIALTLTFLVKVRWRDWGLVGLLVLFASVTSLLTLINLNQWMSPRTPSTDVPGYDAMLWGWRCGAGVGGGMVLVGLLIEFKRNRPFLRQTLRRLSLGVAVIAAIALGFWWAS